MNEEKRQMKNNNKMKIKNEMKIQKIEEQQKPSRRFFQAKYHRWEFLTFNLKKIMIAEGLLVLPLYLILFFVWWRFQLLIKAMTDVENIFHDDFLEDIADTPKEGTEQYTKWECLKSVIGRGKGHLLETRWKYERVDKASDETINKKYVEYIQRDINEKSEKTGKALGKHVIKLYSTGISQ